MKARSEAKVYQVLFMELGGKHLKIQHMAGGFFLVSDDQVVAECEYAKALSDWAFKAGAFSVRHDYDLKLSDHEP